MKQIPQDLYSEIVRNIPILCVDIIIVIKDSYLLIKRSDEPLKNYWWTPGGRIYLGETLKSATKRKIFEELGFSVKEDKPRPVGIYQDVFNRSNFSRHKYHTCSILFQLDLEQLPPISLDSSSKDWCMKKKLPKRLTNNSIFFDLSG